MEPVLVIKANVAEYGKLINKTDCTAGGQIGFELKGFCAQLQSEAPPKIDK
jgi:hypothetical protein